MDLIELSQHECPQNPHESFSLISNRNRIFVRSVEPFCTVLDIKYNPESTDDMNFAFGSIFISKTKPILQILKKYKIDYMKIYRNSSVPNRHVLTLDPVLASLISEDGFEPTVNGISTPPKNVFSEDIIAVVNNVGCCAIQVKPQFERNWNSTILTLNDIWVDIFPEVGTSLRKAMDEGSLEDLQNTVNDFHITTCTWLSRKLYEEHNKHKLYCSTASGRIVAVDISLKTNSKISYLYKFQTGMTKINEMKSFNTNSHRSFILTSDINGEIKCFKDNFKNRKFLLCSSLWSTRDKMRCRHFEIQHDKQNSRILIVTSKAAHFLVFCLNERDGKLISKQTFYVGNLLITGLISFDPYNYMVCTITGYIGKLSVEYFDHVKTISISSRSLKHDLNRSHNQVLGMVCTQNKVAFLFFLQPKGMYEKRYRVSSQISVCLSTTIGPQPLALMINDAENDLSNHVDTAEVIRTMVLKEISDKDLIEFSHLPVQTNDSFLHRLRVRYVILSALYRKQQRERRKHEPYEAELTTLQAVIQAIGVYRRLYRLSTMSNSLTKFQKLSLKCMYRFLSDFTKTETITENVSSSMDSLLQIKQILIPVFDALLDNLNTTIRENNCKEKEEEEENCIYCQKKINPENGICEDEHNNQRCPITFVQLPFICKQYCGVCKVPVLDNNQLVREVLSTNVKQLKCPLCNFDLLEYKV